MSETLYYLDYNSTAPLAPGVFGALQAFLGSEYGNPSNTLTSLGKRAAHALHESREIIAACAGSETDEVVFVSGGTESCFLALSGAVFAQQNQARHAIISVTEHPAVKQTLEFLAISASVETRTIAVDSNGKVSTEEVLQNVVPGTIVSLMLANNETGAFLGIEELVPVLKKRGAIVHTDASQVVGKEPISFRDLGVDLLSFTGHKLGGPKGSGALLIRRGTPWISVMPGGGQEHGRRGGTEAVAQSAGLAAALACRQKLFLEGGNKTVQELRNEFESIVCSQLEDCSPTVREGRLGNTSSLHVRGVIAHDLVAALSDRGVIISAGSACKTANFEPSAVLLAMGRTTMEALCTVRVSLGFETSREQVLQASKIFIEEARRLRAQSAGAVERLTKERTHHEQSNVSGI